MRDKNYQVSEGRKIAYYGGMVLVGLGFILFLSTFFAVFRSDPFSNPPSMATSLVGFILIVIGTALRAVGAKGLAGSGVLLDPKRARDDLEPYARTAGGLIQDALEETDLTKKDTQIKIRCRACTALNDETAKYCNNCGQPL